MRANVNHWGIPWGYVTFGTSLTVTCGLEPGDVTTVRSDLGPEVTPANVAVGRARSTAPDAPLMQRHAGRSVGVRPRSREERCRSVLLDAFPRERVGGPAVADEVLVQAQGMPQEQASVECRVRASEIPGRAYVGEVFSVILHRRDYHGRGDAAGQRRISDRFLPLREFAGNLEVVRVDHREQAPDALERRRNRLPSLEHRRVPSSRR